MVLGSAKTICVVDDDVAVRESLKLLLETHGFTVHDFAKGSDFLDDCAGKSADCLVLDVNMPLMSGDAVVDELGRRGLRIPTILITAHADRESRRRADSGGVFALLLKPFDSGKLLELITRAVGGAAPRTEPA